MGCKMNSLLSPPIPYKFYTNEPKFGRRNTTIIFSSIPSEEKQQQKTISTSTTTIKTPSTSQVYSVVFKTQRACKLGISRYPDFEYDAEGGIGTAKVTENSDNDELLVSFDIETLYIPPLTSSTTKFLGLPLPPFLKIDIVPEAFQGSIDKESGKVDLEFKSKFLFSAGSLYKAPPLLVKTVLTSEESKGAMKSGRGQRLDEEGKCRLVGVSRVDPIDDFLMNSFLGLPTECLADMNAVISISSTS